MNAKAMKEKESGRDGSCESEREWRCMPRYAGRERNIYVYICRIIYIRNGERSRWVDRL